MQVIGGNVSTDHSSLSTTSTISQSSLYCNYSVKIMNPKKKSDFEIVQLKAKQRFECVDDLKDQLCWQSIRKRSAIQLSSLGTLSQDTDFVVSKGGSLQMTI